MSAIGYSRDIVRHLIVTKGEESATRYIMRVSDWAAADARGFVYTELGLASLRATQSKAMDVDYFDWLMGNNKKWDAL